MHERTKRERNRNSEENHDNYDDGDICINSLLPRSHPKKGGGIGIDRNLKVPRSYGRNMMISSRML